MKRPNSKLPAGAPKAVDYRPICTAQLYELIDRLEGEVAVIRVILHQRMSSRSAGARFILVPEPAAKRN